MTPVTPSQLGELAANVLTKTTPGQGQGEQPQRLFSIWEITTWILPMAPEHFRRVLAAVPTLPQGSAGAEGGTRWFTQSDLATLRAYFIHGRHKTRYQPIRRSEARAPLVVMTGPAGAMSRTTTLLHLAVGGTLSGYRILVIEGDPAGTLGLTLPMTGGPAPAIDGLGKGVLSLIARSAAEHLRHLNEARLDRGDTPQPMDAVLAAALPLTGDDLIRPTLWPGLDIMAMSYDGTGSAMLGDVQIANWRQTLRGWQPGLAVGLAIDRAGLRQRYDLILCDTARGLGPLTLSLLTSADVLLAPLPLQDGALNRLATGLYDLATANTLMQAEAQNAARALGQVAPAQVWPMLRVLPTRAGADAPQRLTSFAAKLGAVLLPTPLPEIEAVATGQVAHLYDLDYRHLGRLAYAPLRQASNTTCCAVIEALTGLAAKP